MCLKRFHFLLWEFEHALLCSHQHTVIFKSKSQNYRAKDRAVTTERKKVNGRVFISLISNIELSTFGFHLGFGLDLFSNLSYAIMDKFNIICS